ncbi:diguanylate cyclase [Planctobacterium marinum]|uniref:Serine/threonine protein kinase n=1 Tax=Planctobacterium marinum TaxID=1631968 RepID=A0AA48HXV8_9ALTE|nr:serine/threonine protein kinase [Planctobacterium marinum]
MFQIGCYKVREKLFESSGTIVYRVQNADSESNGFPQTVILKLLNQDFPTSEQLARFRREFELTKKLSGKGVIEALDLIRHENSLVMVLEDFEGDSLSNVYRDRPMRLPEFWRFALKIVDCLALVHGERVIHKDINPSNILLNTQTQKIKLIDFGISIELASENIDAEKPGVLKGTLAYISPEQTGRMNRILDYRTDFYSLGITFYQMLTNKLPFSAEDAIEWVHAHIAKIPQSPHELNPRIPKPLSELVMKLIAKNAEDRYVTIAGLRRDLEICRREHSTTGDIGHFILGANDHSGELNLSQKIYGRELEIATMLGLYDKVVRGKNALLTVSGASGIGKTSLIREIQKPVVSRQGYYTEGKFDQFERSTPYSAILQASTSLVRQILTESQQQIETWKTRLLTALEGNGQLVIDVIPEMKHIIGEQPKLANVQGTELENRFHRTFQRFMRAVCDTERPLVIFLDDMQWCDLATLKLVQVLLNDSHIKHLYLVLTWRDNEVNETHPLSQALEELKNTQTITNNLKLSPLSAQDMNRFIADSTGLEVQSCRQLASLCYEKTLGNPFYLNQFLLSLYDAGQIRFSQERMQWTWDIATLVAADSTDNVIDLMLKKMTGLSDEALVLMQRAACIGNRFELDTLATISGRTVQQVAKLLMEALKAGFLVPVDEAWQWAQYLDPETEITHTTAIKTRAEYRFLHDRVQQAAYTSMSEDERKQLHIQIGRKLSNQLSGGELSERIFEVVNHFNVAREYIKDDEERLNIIHKNRLAGQKARASAAFSTAQSYFTMSIGAIVEQDWSNKADIIIGIFLEAAEVCCINNSYGEMESILLQLESRTEDKFARLSAMKIRILALIAQNHSDKAVSVGLEAISLFDISLPDAPDELDVQESISSTLLELSKVSDDWIVYQNDAIGPEIQIALDVLNVFTAAAFRSQPMLFALLVCKMIQLSLRKGSTGTSSFAFATLGILLCGLVGDVKSGKRYAEVAKKLNRRFSATDIEVKTVYVIKTFVEIWQAPLKTSIVDLRNNFQLALTRGDLEYAAMSAMMEKVHSFYQGQNLTDLGRTTEAYLESIDEAGQEVFHHYVCMLSQTISNLQTQCEKPWILEGDYYQESSRVSMHESVGDHTALAKLYSFKQFIAFFAEEWQQAQIYTDKLEPLLPGVVSSIYVPQYYFYAALTLIMNLKGGELASQELAILKEYSAKLDFWADNCRANFGSKAMLLKAEIYHLSSSFDLKNIKLYEKAISIARDSGQLHEEALGNEFLARFWLKYEKSEIAQIYLRRAYHLYDLWGCELKKAKLSQGFQQLLNFETIQKNWEKTPTTVNSGFTQNQDLDFNSVMKASQAISGEIVKEKLIQTMMLLVVENAGAQNATLLLRNKGLWQWTASAKMEGKKVELFDDDFSFMTDERLPLQVLQYVLRTQKALAIHYAPEDPLCAQDAYVVKYQPESILCVPILHRNEVTGLLYMENNLLRNAFTPERIEIIQLLASQMVISMDNATLYAELEARVAERTHKLHEANEKLTLLATLDSLTGSFNRRHFIEVANTEMSRSMRSGRPLGIMMIDIDHFKAINDRYGHSAGDEALKKVVKTCMDTLRPGDIFGRLGGEEFAVILPDTDIQLSANVAERLRSSVEQLSIESPPHQFSVTLSIGVCSYTGNEHTLEHLLHVADQGLYRAKREGRNRVLISED